VQIITTNDTLKENTEKAENFESAMESLTRNITDENTDRVITTCTFIDGDTLQRRRLRVRKLQEVTTLVTYTMEYKSNHTNVTDYDDLFKEWMNFNTEKAVDVLNVFGVDATSAGDTYIKEDTGAPTAYPSFAPMEEPSSLPSMIPSVSPSELPTLLPSIGPTEIPSRVPSNGPSLVPSISPTQIMSVFPSVLPTSRNINVTIAAVLGSFGLGALLFMFGFCVTRRRNREGDDRPRSPLSRLMPGLRSPKNQAPPPLNGDNEVVFPVENPNGILVVGNEAEVGDGSMSSENSLISTGSSRERHDSDSDIEYNDDTYTLADEFDKYKDQNLEKMRSEVEGMSSNFDGMMSQALTKALMDDMDDEDGAFSEMTIDPPTSMEIEATVLCDISDWLKKKEGASADDRREFMQETLNEMVSKVRRGMVSPEDASRTIHGSAAMLGLQLAETLPETTLIVTGMRKQVTKDHVVKAFREFGEIESVAVSSKQRGFGVVRYRSPKSVQNAMDRFRYGEIVVQDVGVMIRVLKVDSMGEVDFTRQYSNERGRVR